MGKKEVTTIDGLFGSKTRVKLLHLFLNNPGKSFYVREITRLIDEQINSVRRELSNLLGVGVITSSTSDNKLYYEINQRYDFYIPFRAIFAGEVIEASKVKKAKTQTSSKISKDLSWSDELWNINGLRVAIAAGALVKGSASKIDLLLVGSMSAAKVDDVVATIEKSEGRSIAYTTMSYDEFYYRLSVRDRFVSELFANRHTVIVDTDNIIQDSSR
ncbi:transcriptional regulator [Candidatus Saccharibacteria bacterium]|nr:transcriptional regulator [Candidatus Saccharibacteria bacterium]